MTTVINQSNVRIVLHGDLRHDDLALLEDEVGRFTLDPGRLEIDLADVRFADAAGARSLRHLSRLGVTLRRPSPYLRTLIGSDGPATNGPPSEGATP